MHLHLTPPLTGTQAKLAKYRNELIAASSDSGSKGEGFEVVKYGDARVAMIGFPSVGKVASFFLLNLP